MSADTRNVTCECVLLSDWTTFLDLCVSSTVLLSDWITFLDLCVSSTANIVSQSSLVPDQLNCHLVVKKTYDMSLALPIVRIRQYVLS